MASRRRPEERSPPPARRIAIFITLTTVFTAQLGAALAFAILVDVAVQLNVWRVIGWVLAVLVAAGGLVLTIGNTGDADLGVNAMLGVDPKNAVVPDQVDRQAPGSMKTGIPRKHDAHGYIEGKPR